MIIAGIYSFNRGQEIIENQYAAELAEVWQVVAAVESPQYKTKTSLEKTMPGRRLCSPRSLNKAFKAEFESRQWHKHKEMCKYPDQYYTSGYASPALSKGAFREMDFVKNRIGVEVQFSKYASIISNVCAKMTIFHNLNVIDVGIEIVPIKAFADEMSTGVSYFEQFVWDLEHRGIADIDIPVLILGMAE
jgi:hypothetical protein